jgi:hypothetical protein
MGIERYFQRFFHIKYTLKIYLPAKPNLLSVQKLTLNCLNLLFGTSVQKPPELAYLRVFR